MRAIKPQIYFNINPQLLPIRKLWVENVPMENSIGKKIKFALEQQGRTQTWLAEEVGVSNFAVTKWIQGGNVGRENIPKVAKLLDIPISVFITGSDKDEDQQLANLVVGWRFLTTQQKTMLSQFYDALTKQSESTSPKHNGTQ